MVLFLIWGLYVIDIEKVRIFKGIICYISGLWCYDVYMYYGGFKKIGYFYWIIFNIVWKYIKVYILKVFWKYVLNFVVNILLFYLLLVFIFVYFVNIFEMD